uniref:Alpha/beta hydrolase fold-3 domain-containing protein n=1 Tax=Sphenodon punctatus TaxID=8508 RepID=A0A8D0GKE7_SPHPU
VLSLSILNGRILENLGICSQLKFVRFMRRGKKHKDDPKLFIKDLKFDNVPVRIYQPKAPSAGQRRGVLFFHGGGWIFGSINTHENICRYIAKETESVVMSVEYRLAPENLHPAQYEDCLAATIHFMKNTDDYGVDPARLIIAGDSAGGNIAVGVCQTLVGRKDLLKPRAQVLIYPGLQAMDFNLPSYQQNRAVPILFRERAAFYALQCLIGNASVLEDVLQGSHVPPDIRQKYAKWMGAHNIPDEFKVRGYKPLVPAEFVPEVYEVVKDMCSPSLSPILAEDATIRQLPETCILTCEYDVLRDDGLLFKKRLEDNGVQVTWFHVEDGFHAIISLFDKGRLAFPSGKKGLDKIVGYIKGL